MKALASFFPPEQVVCGETPCLRLLTDNHTLDFHQVDRSPDIVVTFDPMSAAPATLVREREGWGVSWLARQGYNVLAIKPQGNDWYRDPSLRAIFRSLGRGKAFARYRRVIFYGGSMGGFGALTFARVAPGATVIALNPQTTLDARKVPWEKRFIAGQQQSWAGDFADAADVAKTAGRVVVVYDPHDQGDRLHVERLKGRIDHFRVPYMGHGLPPLLQKAGILHLLFPGVMDGSLTTQTFPALARARKKVGNHWLRLAERARGTARRALLERGMAVEPRFPGCYVALAGDLLAAGDAEAAEAVGRAAYTQFPYNAPTLSVLADVLVARGNLDEAEPIARRAADVAPSDPRGMLRLAQIALGAGRLDEATDLANTTIARAEAWPGVQHRAAQLLWRIRRQAQLSKAAQSAA